MTDPTIDKAALEAAQAAIIGNPFNLERMIRAYLAALKGNRT